MAELPPADRRYSPARQATDSRARYRGLGGPDGAPGGAESGSAERTTGDEAWDMICVGHAAARLGALQPPAER